MSGYEYEKLNPKLAILKQKGSKNYYVRMWIKDASGRGEEHRQTLKTADKDEAIKKSVGVLLRIRKQTLTCNIFVQ